MAELFVTPQQGQPERRTSRRTAMTDVEIAGVNQKVAVTIQANRRFALVQRAG